MDTFSETLLRDNGIKVYASRNGYSHRVVLNVELSGGVMPEIIVNGEVYGIRPTAG